MKIVLLIDADNAQPQKMPAILKLLCERGCVPVRRAYGNWSKEQYNSWMDITRKLSIKQEQQPDYVTGKNATDMALVIGALDLLHKDNYDAFAIVSSDSDFTPLAVYLREAGIQVFGFGKESTPEAFRSSCDTFTSLEELEPRAPVPVSAQPAPSSPPKSRIVLDAEDIHSALHVVAQQKNEPEDGYTQLAEVGSYLHNSHPQHKLSYAGHARLQSFIAAYPKRYQLNKKGKITLYRCLAQQDTPANKTVPAPLQQAGLVLGLERADSANTPASPVKQHVPAKVHRWLRQIHESSNTPDNFSTMGHTGYCLRKLAREAGTDFNVKLYGFSKLINLIKAFPKLYEIREEKHGNTTIYAYKCRVLTQKLA